MDGDHDQRNRLNGVPTVAELDQVQAELAAVDAQLAAVDAQLAARRENLSAAQQAQLTDALHKTDVFLRSQAVFLAQAAVALARAQQNALIKMRAELAQVRAELAQVRTAVDAPAGANLAAQRAELERLRRAISDAQAQALALAQDNEPTYYALNAHGWRPTGEYQRLSAADQAKADQRAARVLAAAAARERIRQLEAERADVTRAYQQTAVRVLEAASDQPLATGAEQVEQHAQRPLWKQVYETYRRRHAKNPRISLRQVCEESGVDYDNIRAAKYRAEKRKK